MLNCLLEVILMSAVFKEGIAWSLLLFAHEETDVRWEGNLHLIVNDDLPVMVIAPILDGLGE